MAIRCPDWCAGGHHCTAEMPAGEHTSIPEIWSTGIGRLMATRRQGEQRHGWLEIRVSVRLPTDESTAHRYMRHMIAASYFLISRIISRQPKADTGSTR